MDFSEALVHLKNGEYIKRESWNNKKYYYKLKDNMIYASTEDYVLITNNDVLTNDWEIYKKMSFSPGTLIQLEDGTVGIVVEYIEDNEECVVLTENECVETFHETEVSRVEGEELEPFIDTTQAFYDGLIRKLRDCSNELEENK